MERKWGPHHSHTNFLLCFFFQTSSRHCTTCPTERWSSGNIRADDHILSSLECVRGTPKYIPLLIGGGGRLCILGPSWITGGHMYFDNIQVVNCLVGFSRSATVLIAALMIVRHCTLIIFCCCYRLSSLLHHYQYHLIHNCQALDTCSCLQGPALETSGEDFVDALQTLGHCQQKFHLQKSQVFSPVTWKYLICCRWSLTSVSWHNCLPWKFNWNNKASFLFERSRTEENTKGTKQVLPHVLLAVIYNYKYKGFCAICLSKNLNFLFNIQYTQYIDRKENNYFQIDCTP